MMSTPRQMQRHQRIVRPDVSAESAVFDAPDTAEAASPFPPETEQRRKNVPRGRARKDSFQDGQAPTAAELAEALFTTTQALKSVGRLCMEESIPALRTISFPRARVLMVMADAQQGQAPISHRSAHRSAHEHGRGRHRHADGVTDCVTEVQVRMNDLAEALGVTARNITTIVDGLEREGLIARRPDPTDRRAILLVLTPKGQEHLAEVHALQHAIAGRFFAPLDAAERTELLRLLIKVGGNARAC